MNNVELFVTTKENSKSKKGKYQIFVLNDNITVYDNVINALQDICGHSYIQAGQCATIMHNVGKCSVFIDSYDECDEILREFLSLNIKAELQKYKSISNVNRNKKSDN